MPERIQLSRKKGWRMPPDTVRVDRSSRFGNPFRATGHTPQQVVDAFRGRIEGAHVTEAWDMQQAARRDLRGKNLACWRKLGAPCHADILLELANRPMGQGGGND
jgi:hypothetical protein